MRRLEKGMLCLVFACLLMAVMIPVQNQEEKTRGFHYKSTEYEENIEEETIKEENLNIKRVGRAETEIPETEIVEEPVYMEYYVEEPVEKKEEIAEEKSTTPKIIGKYFAKSQKAGNHKGTEEVKEEKEAGVEETEENQETEALENKNDFCAVLYLNGGHMIGEYGNQRKIENGTLEMPGTPKKSGYYFEGWYADEKLTEKVEFPYKVETSMISLYAKWIERSSPYVLQGKKLVEYSGTAAELEEGTLELPSNVTGVGADAFRWNTSHIQELRIRAGLTEIEPGAFHGLKYLHFLDVDWKNPAFTVVNCGLHTKDKKTLVAYPAGLTGIYTISENTEVIESHALCESLLSGLVLPATLKKIGGFAFGPSLETLRFKRLIPPEYIDRTAFEKVSGDLVIEVPMEAVEDYRKRFSEFSEKLAKAVTGY